MINPLTRSSLLGIVFLLPIAAFAQHELPHMSVEKFARVDIFIEKNMHALDIPGASVVVSENGEVIHSKHFGIATSDGEPVSKFTAYNIGSISKSFAAVVIGQLIDEGRLKLDDPVIEHLSWFKTADKRTSDQITIRQLLDHSSGISTPAGHKYHDERRTDVEVYEDTVRSLSSESLVAVPGERHVYSNANYLILGCVIERITGQLYEDVVEARVLRPLGMDSSFVIQPKAKNMEIADGFRYWFGQPVWYETRTGRVLSAQQGVYASALDLTTYLREFLIDDSLILSAGYRSIMLDNGATDLNPGYGLGWRIVDIDGYRLIYHYGTGQGYNGTAGFVPDLGLTYVVLINANRSFGARNHLAFVGRVRDMLLERVPRSIAPSTRDRSIRFVLTILPLALILSICRYFREQAAGRIVPLVRPLTLSDVSVRIVGPSLILMCAAAVLLRIPAFTANGSLSATLVYSPDLGWLIVTSVVILAVWALLRPYFRYRYGEAGRS